VRSGRCNNLFNDLKIFHRLSFFDNETIHSEIGSVWFEFKSSSVQFFKITPNCFEKND